ncbi:Remodeling and spacing factor 1 [Sesbania bispinosa]|nr:Remodeling and spacing factor 1 [Sesbania bispinosa]
MHQTGENSTSKLEWKSSPDPFRFGSFDSLTCLEEKKVSLDSISSKLKIQKMLDDDEVFKTTKDPITVFVAGDPVTLHTGVDSSRISDTMLDFTSPAIYSIDSMVVPPELFAKSPFPQFASTAGRVIHSCNGLLCVNHDSDLSIKPLSLWNPATRQVRKVPPNVFNPVVNNYRVVKISISDNCMGNNRIIDHRVREAISVDWYAQKLLDELLKKDVVMFPMDSNVYNKFVHGKLDLDTVQMMFLKGMSGFGSADIVEIYPCLSALMQALQVSEWMNKNGVCIFSPTEHAVLEYFAVEVLELVVTPITSVLNFLDVFSPILGNDLKLSAEENETGLVNPDASLAKLHVQLLKGIPPVSKTLDDSDK